MDIDTTLALVCILIGMAIAIPLTLLIDQRAARMRKKADAHWQTVIRLEAERDAQAQSNQDQLDKLHATLAVFEQKFAVIANSALSSSGDQFLKLASENFEKFNRTATHDLDSLVKPLRENLTKYENSLRRLELDRKEDYTSIRQHITDVSQSNEKLRQETDRLVQALQKPKVRGRWGEIQLRNVLELVGMAEYIDFEMEKSFQTADGLKRPDAVVRLPGDRCIVIDAKTPLEAYLMGLEAESEADQKECFRSHAQQLRKQVKVLSDSDYQNVVPNTLDFVIMFIPGESFYSVAMQHDPSLFDHAIRHQVMITTPTSLVVLLKIIALGWQQEKLTENAKEIATIGRRLYERLSTFTEHLREHGRFLGKSIESFDRAVGSLESRVLPSARRLEELEVVPRSARKQIESPAKLDQRPRPVSDIDTRND